jgi:tRNA (cytidine/uridine-2'-O-)-methyltransferase
MRIALFEPDIPQNTGAILRLAACTGVGVDIVGPCGFLWSDRRLKRAGLDYLDRADTARHDSWSAYWRSRKSRSAGGRLILLTTRARASYLDFAFRPDDTLLLGRESAGVPEPVFEAADARLRIPLAPGLRSLNVALAAAMALGEALRQTGGFAGMPAGEGVGS